LERWPLQKANGHGVVLVLPREDLRNFIQQVQWSQSKNIRAECEYGHGKITVWIEKGKSDSGRRDSRQMIRVAPLRNRFLTQQIDKTLAIEGFTEPGGGGDLGLYSNRSIRWAGEVRQQRILNDIED
jgi:hypothetical protein